MSGNLKHNCTFQKVPDNVAIIVVDVQKGFINKHTRNIPEKIKILLERYRFKHIIFTQFINAPNSPFRVLLNWNKLGSGDEIEIVDELKASATLIIKKYGYTSVNEEFKKYVRKHSLNVFLITGVDTDACVLKTAVDLFENGYVPYILKDYCASSGGHRYHRYALKILSRSIGKERIISERDLNSLLKLGKEGDNI